jgi:hypothetical protein
MTERWLQEMRRITETEPSVDLLERAELGPSLPDAGPRPASRVMIAVFALLIAVAGSLGIFAIGRQDPNLVGDGSPSVSQGDASRVLDAIGSSRLTVLNEASDSTVVVIGRATPSSGDATRTLWYATLAAAAYAQDHGLSRVERIVQDTSGTTLESETDAATAGRVDPFSPPTLSSTDIQTTAEQGGRTLGASVVDVHYIPLYGGTAEIVVRPDNLSTFLASAGSNGPVFLGTLATDFRPYLLTIVNAGGAPQLILGWVPGVGGSEGQGLGWVAPGVETDAIWG